ncbi:unnamed protein product, partial [Rotaria magnacalcarata]
MGLAAVTKFDEAVVVDIIGDGEVTAVIIVDTDVVEGIDATSLLLLLLFDVDLIIDNIDVVVFIGGAAGLN